MRSGAQCISVGPINRDKPINSNKQTKLEWWHLAFRRNRCVILPVAFFYSCELPKLLMNCARSGKIMGYLPFHPEIPFTFWVFAYHKTGHYFWRDKISIRSKLLDGVGFARRVAPCSWRIFYLFFFVEFSTIFANLLQISVAIMQ